MPGVRYRDGSPIFTGSIHAIPIVFRTAIVGIGTKEPVPAQARNFRDGALGVWFCCPGVGRGECSSHGTDGPGEKCSTRIHGRLGVDLHRMQLSSLRFPVSNRKVEVRNWVILKRNFARILREDLMEPLATVRKVGSWNRPALGCAGWHGAGREVPRTMFNCRASLLWHARSGEVRRNANYFQL